jgi:hypothetical protein
MDFGAFTPPCNPEYRRYCNITMCDHVTVIPYHVQALQADGRDNGPSTAPDSSAVAALPADPVRPQRSAQVRHTTYSPALCMAVLQSTAPEALWQHALKNRT